MQKFTSEEHAKFKAADPDDVVCVRVGQIAVLIEQNEQLLAKNEQLLAKDVRSEEEKGVDFAWWVPYFLAHCNYWMIFGAFWSHLEIPIDLRYFISVLSYGP